jgi:hypothetical protein
VKVIWLAILGGPDGPDPTLGAPEAITGGCGAGLAVTARGAAVGGLRDARIEGVCGFGEGEGDCTVTGGKGCVSGAD